MTHKTILHITHTDIRSDSRILKEMYCLKNVALKNNFELYGIGLETSEESKISKTTNDLNLIVCPKYTSKFFSRFKFIKHAVNFAKLFFAMIKIKPKIIHCHDTLVLPIGLFAKLFYGSKVIYDAHELESDRNAQGFINSKVTKLIEIVAWKYLSLFITVSPSIAKWYIDRFGEKKNITVLNSPKFEQTNFKKVNKFKLREKFNIRNDEKIFVYLGIFGVGRGIEKILDVFSDSEVKAHLLFVGWGPLKNKINEFCIRNTNIHIHDAVDHVDVVPLVSECNYGICMIESISLSDYLCLPNKLFEYCFANLPVLASELPELTRVINDHELGHVCKDDINSIKTKVTELDNSNQKYNFKKIDLLSWEMQEKKLVESYIDLLA